MDRNISLKHKYFLWIVFIHRACRGLHRFKAFVRTGRGFFFLPVSVVCIKTVGMSSFNLDRFRFQRDKRTETVPAKPDQRKVENKSGLNKENVLGKCSPLL